MKNAGNTSPLDKHYDQIVAWIAEGVTNPEIGRRLGSSEKSIRRFRVRHGIPDGPVLPVSTLGEPTSSALDLDALRKALQKSTNRGINVTDLADKLDVSPKRVLQGLEDLKAQGYRVEQFQDIAFLDTRPAPADERYVGNAGMFDGDLVRFGVVSDIHICSKADNPEQLHNAYAKFQAEGITEVFNVGDTFDGKGIFRGHIREVYVHTFDEQVDRVDDIYPRGKDYGGIKTKAIGGNHDLEGDFGREGADPVLALSHRRDDFEYLGPYSAWVDLPNGASIHLLHPQGGASYANSYRPQKIAESYQDSERPAMTLIGHWHRHNWTSWLGVQTFLVGTFQGATTFSVRKAMGPPAFGFWIMEARMNDDGGLVEVVPTWFPLKPTRFLK